MKRNLEMRIITNKITDSGKGLVGGSDTADS
jgi:hypothetical protein